MIMVERNMEMEIKHWSLVYGGLLDMRYHCFNDIVVRIQEFINSDEDEMKIRGEVKIKGEVFRHPSVLDGSSIMTSPVKRIRKVSVNRRRCQGLLAETQNSEYLILFEEQNCSEDLNYAPLYA